MTVPLAATRAKLPRSIEIMYNNAKVGAVDKITIDQKVDLMEWREFDSTDQGQVVEWCPTKEEISFSLEGVILYSGDIIDRIYAGGAANGVPVQGVESLLDMQSSFDIEISESRFAPDINDNPVVTSPQSRTTKLTGCRFSNRPFTVDIGSANLIRQECQGKAARITRTVWA